MENYIFTCGDINGIGPEIVVKTLNKIYNPSNYNITFICPQNVFIEVLSVIKPKFKFKIVNKLREVSSENKEVTVYNFAHPRISAGRPTKTSGSISYKSMIIAYDLIDSGKYNAVITSPLSKQAISSAGVNFPGQTEMLAEWCGAEKYGMFFLSKIIKCSLATIHIPHKLVSRKLTKRAFKNHMNLVSDSLAEDFKIDDPRIAVLGLNPHAGEEGLIGDEERNVISPVIDELNNNHISGPFVPDAFFARGIYKSYDFVVGMYHDQILIPFKILAFNKGVNYTAGLPIVRTSPDHGTAYDIAYKMEADASSMIESFNWAKKIVKTRRVRLASS
jgi:4-hydroxythreonine-4-phosphate dehydrogenase